jgi:hypothetical protein
MWWYVKQVAHKEIHVYPVQERCHLLLADLCDCRPEVRYAGGVRMVVHKRVASPSPLKPAFPAHWVTLPGRFHGNGGQQHT